VEAVREAIKLLAHVPLEERPGIVQDPALVTKAPRLKKEQGLIDWTRTADQISSQVRAFQPWPGSYSFLHRGSEPPIRLICEKVSRTTLGPTIAACGGIVENHQDSLWVQTGDGVLSLDVVQPAGKRVMSASEFLNGHPVKAGDHFGAEEHLYNPQRHGH
jgi:methionyl-tRNA formyltransferase